MRFATTEVKKCFIQFAVGNGSFDLEIFFLVAWRSDLSSFFSNASLSRWNHVDSTWTVGAHCARLGTVGPAERQDGPQFGLFFAKMEEEDQKDNFEVINVNRGECISERIVEQTVEPAQSVGEAQPLGIAKHSASTDRIRSRSVFWRRWVFWTRKVCCCSSAS